MRNNYRSDYRRCEYCGCYLDIGEKCDCQQRKKALEQHANTFKFNLLENVCYKPQTALNIK